MLSPTSMSKLATCCDALQRLFNEVAKTWDILIVTGYRGKEEQDAAYKDNKSRRMWPGSLHNKKPSEAADVMPLPLNWTDYKTLDRFAVFVKAKAAEMAIEIKWGGDFQSLKDYGHWEIKQKF